MFSGNINSGLQVADHSNPLQHHQQQNPQHHMRNQPHIVLFGSSSSSHHDTETHQHHHQQQQINKHHGNINYPPFSAKNKHHQQGSPSDEDDTDTISTDPNKSIKKNSFNSNNASPWQRMKWTDTMVRLLIMAVYYIGDEGGGGDNDPSNNGKKVVKPTGLVLQKKGKWKSVSRAMMEKGFYVSPQQCEDKFNDLNKRYKRVNDILGKGTACKVVENQNLLETMDHLSQKMKEEVRKLLNSKHLFFREMCAYHNSCGHGGSVSHNQAEVGIIGSDASQSQKQQEQEQQKQHQEEQEQKCFHSSNEGVSNLGVLKLGCKELDDSDDHDCDGDDDESEDYSDDVEENESGEGGLKGDHHEDDDDHEDNENNNKRPRKLLASSSSSSQSLIQQLSNEVNGVFHDGGKSMWEKKQWLKSRIMDLEEKQVNYQNQAFEIEKKRLKWERFSSKQEREMEKAKLENEKRRLENKRMVLIIQQKEIELMNLQQHQQQQHSFT